MADFILLFYFKGHRRFSEATFKVLVVKLSIWNEMGLASGRTLSLTVCEDNSPAVPVHALVGVPRM